MVMRAKAVNGVAIVHSLPKAHPTGSKSGYSWRSEARIRGKFTKGVARGHCHSDKSLNRCRITRSDCTRCLCRVHHGKQLCVVLHKYVTNPFQRDENSIRPGFSC